MPWQLGRLCPADLRVMLKAASERERKRWYREAWSVAHLLNIEGKTVKTKVTPGKLLGTSKSSDDD